MNIWVCYLNLAFVCLFANNVGAYELSPKSMCVIEHAQVDNGIDVSLLQYRFEDGAYDLAMLLPSGEIKRVTFGGSNIDKCHYKSMTLLRGGSWGWHVAWVMSDDLVLNYARMDGEAWVSSPPKKLSKHVEIMHQPSILTFEQNVWIVWSISHPEIHQIYVVHSDDEGRSWLPTKLLTETAVEVSQLRLRLHAGKPYLHWNDKAESQSLLQY
jgi:hypothetical protein